MSIFNTQKIMTVTLRNNFHRSATTFNVIEGSELSHEQMHEISFALCNVDYCTCGGDLNECGPQNVKIESLGYDDKGYMRVRLTSFNTIANAS